MTIFDDLRASHEIQRSLARTMTHGRASGENRRAAFLALAHELDAHATAEERHFYVPLLMDDAGLSVTRHALADHHKAEKLVEQLRGVELRDPDDDPSLRCHDNTKPTTSSPATRTSSSRTIKFRPPSPLQRSKTCSALDRTHRRNPSEPAIEIDDRPARFAT